MASDSEAQRSATWALRKAIKLQTQATWALIVVLVLILVRLY